MTKTNNSTYETIRHMRGSWGNISPVTKIISNKKKNYIPGEYDEFYNMEDCICDSEPSLYYWDEMEDIYND